MEPNGTERNRTRAEHEALMNLAGLDIPDPPSDLEFLGIRVHEIDGPGGERLLLAFGLIRLMRWLDVVNAYNASFGEPPAYSAEDDSTAVQALNRLSYQRVGYEAVGDTFKVLWTTWGVVPVTVWMVASREY
jgi:hypothetical protein